MNILTCIGFVVIGWLVMLFIALLPHAVAYFFEGVSEASCALYRLKRDLKHD